MAHMGQESLSRWDTNMLGGQRYLTNINIDANICPDRDVIAQLKHLMDYGSISGSSSWSGICPIDLVQTVYQIAHLWNQPIHVKCHAVNLLELFLASDGDLYKTTVPLIVVLASKLNLHYTSVSMDHAQKLLQDMYGRHYTLSQLMCDEQYILRALDFKVERKYLLELVELIIAILQRMRPKRNCMQLLDCAGQLVCSYQLNRKFLPSILWNSLRDSAASIVLLTKILHDEAHHINKTFLDDLSIIVNRNSLDIIRNTEVLRRKILRTTKKRISSHRS